jgi:hypothetical protein
MYVNVIYLNVLWFALDILLVVCVNMWFTKTTATIRSNILHPFSQIIEGKVDPLLN